MHITYEDLESPSDEAIGDDSQLDESFEVVATTTEESGNEVEETVTEEINTSIDVSTDTSTTDTSEEIEEVIESSEDVETPELVEIANENDPVDVNTTDAEFASDTEKGTVNEGQEQTTAQTTSTASFTDSERAELEVLKKEKKLALIHKYDDFLTEEDKESLFNSVDNYTEEELELILLRKYRNYKETEHHSFNRMAPLAAPEPQKPETADNQLNSYIRRMLRR